MESIGIALLLLAGFVAGVVFTGWFVRRNVALTVDSARADARAELAAWSERFAARSAEVQDLQARLAEAEATMERLRGELSAARESNASLATELENERVQGREKLAVLEDARASLTAQFKALANEILEEKSTRFAEQNRNQIDLLLKPLGDKLQSFEKKVEDTYINEAKERFSLSEEVRKLQQTNLQIGQEALNLTRALKGESKTRGNWGEVVLERILERSGLEKGREYETQFAMDDRRDGETGKLRPDVVVRLPDDKHIVIDSKVSLIAYDRYYAAEDDETARAVALKEHIAAMHRHIDELSAKNYQGRADVNAPDFVAMFVPIEPAFNLAAAHDDELVLVAFEKKVVIVTPNTLLAMLSTVASLWRREQQSRNALEIARQSGALYDQIVRFVDSLREVGARLNAAQTAYDTAERQLVGGRGNVVRRIEEIRKLGAKTEKQFPAALLDAAFDESREERLPESSGTSTLADEPPAPNDAKP